MKRQLSKLAAMALTLNIATAGLAWSQALTDGEVKKIDASAGKITIKHGPMKKFNMEEGMTMVYHVQDPSMLSTVKSGDKIKFGADRVNGQFTVTKLQKAK